MKITVFGASGRVGREIVDQAVTAGHEVKAVYRNRPPKKATPACDILVTKSILDESLITDATNGCDTVISAVGLRRKNPFNPWSPITSPMTLTSDLARILVTVLERNPERPRVIAISAAGVGDSWDRTSPMLRLLFNKSNIGPAYQDLKRMEQVFESSGLDWICVRPCTLLPCFVSESTEITNRYGLFSTVSRRSVASYILNLLESKERLPTRTPMIRGKRPGAKLQLVWA